MPSNGDGGSGSGSSNGSDFPFTPDSHPYTKRVLLRCYNNEKRISGRAGIEPNRTTALRNITSAAANGTIQC